MTFRDWQTGPWGGDETGPAAPKINLHIRRRSLVLLAVLAVLLIGVPLLSNFLSNYYWYSSEGLSGVFWTQRLPQWGLFFVFGAIAGAFAWAGFRTALKHASTIPVPADMEAKLLLRSRIGPWAAAVVALFIAINAGSQSMDHWQMVLQFFHSSAFGTTDAIFGKDVGFYIFSLPFWNFLQEWLVGVLFYTLVGCALIYVLTFAAAYRDNIAALRVPAEIRAHALTLTAVLVVCWGASYWLQRYLLLYSPLGVTFGPSYTDVHANLWALVVLTALSLMAAALLLLAIRSNRSWKFIAVLGGIFVAANILLRGVYPSLVQKYFVVPNEYQKEKPYIEYNIAATLEAYGLDKLTTREIVPDAGLTAQDVAEDRETLENVRLWDYRALLRSYKQLQEIRSYYNFSGVDIDRYMIGGKLRQIMLAPRELDLTGMQNRTWVNQHLEFTHGYGIVMNPAREIAGNGQPLFWIRDLPPVSSVPLKVDRPQIYFGENPSTYIFVKTREKEFDYPMGESNSRSYYQGNGGVSIGTLWRQLVYSIAFGDSKILFSNVFNKDSRVMYHRNIKERLNLAAPFLLFDSDPYMALVDGRLLWIIDAYSISSLYPYAEPVNVTIGEGRSARRQPINYIRNSVKATVDAYDGTMKFYIVDEKDPIIRSWQAIFPSLFQPGSSMSAELRAHIRYPKDLFAVQTEVYRTYHMRDPNTYYNKEDVWNSLKGSEAAGTLDSYYVMLKLQGMQHPEFVLMTSYTPSGRDNMIAWMAARSDGNGYGQLVVYRFPKQTLIYGPNQVSALINQTPEISAQLSLWSQRNSDVIRGHLLVMPIGNSLLYVQPLYLKAEKSDLPELKRIILSTGGRVVWDETFDDALTRLIAGAPPVPPENVASQKTQTHGSHVSTLSDTELQSLAQQARNAWDRSQTALKSADWANYGQAMAELEKILNRMMK